jgi:hypothetical protein
MLQSVLANCPTVQRLYLSGLKNIKHVSLKGLPQLQVVEMMEMRLLESLDPSDCHLKELSLSFCAKIKDKVTAVIWKML